MMKSMLQMSELELAQQEAGHSFRLFSAAGLSVTAAVLALLGMMSRYTPGDQAPLPGMDHLAGQCSLAVALGGMMLAAGWLVRNVIMRRLQWAIVISLSLHLLLIVGLHRFTVDLPLASSDAVPDDPNASLEQLALPDYGGMETPAAQRQVWQRTTDTQLDESQRQELERQITEVDPQIEPQPVQLRRAEQVVPVDTLTRQSQQQQMHRAAELEMQRQKQAAEMQPLDRLEDPRIETRQSQQPDLEARPLDRAEADPQNTPRQLEQVQAGRDPRVTAAAVTPRSRIEPQAIRHTQAPASPRTAALAQTEDPSAEAVDVSSEDARQAVAEARALAEDRQSPSDLPNRQPSDPDGSSSPSPLRVANLRPARAAAANGNPASAAPSSGGDTAIQRNAILAGQAASAVAPAVDVVAARGAQSPNLNATTAASNVSRGRSSVPTGGGAPGSGVRSSPAAPSRITARSGTATGRRSGSQAGPQLGSSVGAAAGSGGSAPRRTTQTAAAAVGTRAEAVAVASPAGRSRAAADLLTPGPASTASQVGRGNRSLPARAGTSTGAPSGSRTGAATPNYARQGLTEKATEPSPRLGANEAGGANRPAGGARRRAASAALPAGALAAEQAGALVIAGPQASVSDPPPGGKLSSDRLTSGRLAGLPRRSAGLPQASRGDGPRAARRPSLPGRAEATRLRSSAASGGAARPQLATERQISGLVPRALPGIRAIPTRQIRPGFSLRRPETRREAVKKMGGNDASEAAVERGLQWLAAHQYPAGNWSIHEPNCQDHACDGPGIFQADSAATGLALLAFLGAGHTHQTGEYQQVVQRGVRWLQIHQKPDGDLFADESQFVWLYSHGMAAIAICEVYGMTQDPELREAAQKSLDFIVAAQHPQFGGWRYRPRFESDTSVSGWQLMALKSGEMAGLQVPSAAYEGAARWLDSVQRDDAPGRFSYHPLKQANLAMTAEGLLMRQYLGAERSDQKLVAGADFLRKQLPGTSEQDAYYWYYATQVMFHLQGPHWESWNAALRDLLVQSQMKEGPVRGSWSPDRPVPDKWGKAGGRHYVTCMNLLMLEVYYRHLPLYINLNP